MNLPGLEGKPSSLPSGRIEFESLWIVKFFFGNIYCLLMDYVVELPTEMSETTAGEFWECCTRFASKVKDKNRGEERKNPVTAVSLKT